MQILFKRLIPLLSLLILFMTGCYKEVAFRKKGESMLSTSGIPLSVDLFHEALHIEDKNMMPATGDANLLFNNRGHKPIMAPDGHQLTLGEFNMVSGKADITCIYQGTVVAVQLQGLIPNGVYSMWVLTFKKPGFHGSFENLIGNGALGNVDGSQNAFTASSSGTASFFVVMRQESLSVFGLVGKCLFSEYEVHLAANYHLDNHTHEGNPGEPSTWITQFAFSFRGN